MFEQLHDLTRRFNEGARYYSGTARCAITSDLPNGRYCLLTSDRRGVEIRRRTFEKRSSDETKNFY